MITEKSGKPRKIYSTKKEGKVPLALIKKAVKAVKKERVAREYNHGTMTKSGLLSAIRGALRSYYSKRWIPKQKYLESVRRPYTGSDKRIKWEYECQECKQWVVKKKLTKTNYTYELDHIEPSGQFTEWEHLGEFARRLFCEIDKLRGLCHICHAKVTYSQTQDRRK